MNNQKMHIPQNYQFKISLPECTVHKFHTKKKTIISEGTKFCYLDSCQIYLSQETQNPNQGFYLRIGTYLDFVEHGRMFVRVNYPENSSYLFQKDQMIFSMSFDKNTPELSTFESILSKYGNLIDLSNPKINSALLLSIHFNCPDDIQFTDITSSFKDTIKKLGKGIGVLAGKANNVMKGPIENQVKSLTHRANIFTQQKISENTKDKWKSFKQKSQQFNKKLTSWFKPVLNTYNKIADTIGEKFDNSQNTIIKRVRCNYHNNLEYSLAFSKSINNAEKSIIETNQVQQQATNNQLQ